MRKLLLQAGVALAVANLIVASAPAADLPVKAFAFPTSQCTALACSGFYVGGTLIGAGSNMDVLGNGINGSVFAAGGAIGLDAGYQFWNGNYFFAFEVFGAYDVAKNEQVAPGMGNQSRWIFGQVAKLGVGLQGLLGAPTQVAGATPSQGVTPIGIPASLANSLLSPYVQVGAVERPWGTGWATGAGADFIIANGWNLDLSYLYVKYDNAQVNPIQSQQSENLLKLSLNRKF